MQSEEYLDGFRRTQRLAFQCAQTTEGFFREGISERQVAQLMETFLKDHGAGGYFHTPFAWFGDRTRFDGMKWYWDFMPSERKLEVGDAVILDCAPMVDGFMADIGYTTSFGENTEVLAAKKLLAEMRSQLPGWVQTLRTRKAVWDRVDQEFQKNDMDCAHRRYPFHVLGHELRRTPFQKIPGLLRPFSVHAYAMVLGRGIWPALLGPKQSGVIPGGTERLWAIEPHLGARGGTRGGTHGGTRGGHGGRRFGAKFEEILVVRPDGEARWLDDDVPHRKVGDAV